MTERQKQIVGAIFLGTSVLNIMMCLNLYHTYGDLVYEMTNVNQSTNAALQSLSRDVWDLKTNNHHSNRTGEFE